MRQLQSDYLLLKLGLFYSRARRKIWAYSCKWWFYQRSYWV